MGGAAPVRGEWESLNYGCGAGQRELALRTGTQRLRGMRVNSVPSLCHANIHCKSSAGLHGSGPAFPGLLPGISHTGLCLLERAEMLPPYILDSWGLQSFRNSS